MIHAHRAHHQDRESNAEAHPAGAGQLHDIERAEAKECKKGVAESPEDEAIRAQFEAQYGDGAMEDEKEE